MIRKGAKESVPSIESKLSLNLWDGMKSQLSIILMVHVDIHYIDIVWEFLAITNTAATTKEDFVILDNSELISLSSWYFEASFCFKFFFFPSIVITEINQRRRQKMDEDYLLFVTLFLLLLKMYEGHYSGSTHHFRVIVFRV